MEKKNKSVGINGENQPQGRDNKGRFAPGNRIAKGGPRPGSGRPPKPKDENLLQRLYDVLDEVSPRALHVLTELLTSEDEKIRLRAAEAILKKTLPDQAMLEVEERTAGLMIHLVNYSGEKECREGVKKIEGLP